MMKKYSTTVKEGLVSFFVSGVLVITAKPHNDKHRIKLIKIWEVGSK